MRSVSRVFGHRPDGLHALGQRRHGALRAEVVGEVDEAEPAPGQHGAEHEERADLAPVEDQHVARRPHPGPTAPVMVHAPLRLGLGHRPAQVACRAGIAGGPDHGQQPLGRDPPLGAFHPLGDDGGHVVVVVGDTASEPGGAASAARALATARLTVLSVVPQMAAAAR